ncbi:MAG TPA: ABC transporter permease [Acidimicrobiales bacterium]|nr:ABC transporter permease [Acidimicrobiales bacterium]
MMSRRVAGDGLVTGPPSASGPASGGVVTGADKDMSTELSGTPGPQKPTSTGAAKGNWRTGPWTDLLREYGVYIFLVGLVVYDVVATQGFTSVAAFRSLAVEAAPLVLVAAGQALAIGTRGIDLSVGSNMALSSAVLPLLFGFSVSQSTEQRSAALAIAGALAVTTAAGLLSGAVIAFLDVQPLIVTLGMQLALRGLAESLTSGNQIMMNDGTLQRLATGRVLGVPNMAIVALLAAAICGVVLRYTTFGRRVISIGGNPRASYISGVPVRSSLLVVYALSGLLAGVAGLLSSAYLGASDPGDIGQLYELLAIAAVVLGGTPLSGGRVTMLGTVAGALVLQLLSNTFVSHNLQPTTATMVEAVIIVAAVYFQKRRGN